MTSREITSLRDVYEMGLVVSIHPYDENHKKICVMSIEQASELWLIYKTYLKVPAAGQPSLPWGSATARKQWDSDCKDWITAKQPCTCVKLSKDPKKDPNLIEQACVCPICYKRYAQPNSQGLFGLHGIMGKKISYSNDKARHASEYNAFVQHKNHDVILAYHCWFLHSAQLCIRQVVCHVQLEEPVCHAWKFLNDLEFGLNMSVTHIRNTLQHQAWTHGPQTDEMREYVRQVFGYTGNSLVFAYTLICLRDCHDIMQDLLIYQNKGWPQPKTSGQPTHFFQGVINTLQEIIGFIGHLAPQLPPDVNPQQREPALHLSSGAEIPNLLSQTQHAAAAQSFNACVHNSHMPLISHGAQDPDVDHSAEVHEQAPDDLFEGCPCSDSDLVAPCREQSEIGSDPAEGRTGATSEMSSTHDVDGDLPVFNPSILAALEHHTHVLDPSSVPAAPDTGHAKRKRGNSHVSDDSDFENKRAATSRCTVMCAQHLCAGANTYTSVLAEVQHAFVSVETSRVGTCVSAAAWPVAQFSAAVQFQEPVPASVENSSILTIDQAAEALLNAGNSCDVEMVTLRFVGSDSDCCDELPPVLSPGSSNLSSVEEVLFSVLDNIESNRWVAVNNEQQWEQDWNDWRCRTSSCSDAYDIFDFVDEHIANDCLSFVAHGGITRNWALYMFEMEIAHLIRMFKLLNVYQEFFVRCQHARVLPENIKYKNTHDKSIEDRYWLWGMRENVHNVPDEQEERPLENSMLGSQDMDVEGSEVDFGTLFAGIGNEAGTPRQPSCRDDQEFMSAVEAWSTFLDFNPHLLSKGPARSYVVNLSTPVLPAYIFYLRLRHIFEFNPYLTQDLRSVGLSRVAFSKNWSHLLIKDDAARDQIDGVVRDTPVHGRMIESEAGNEASASEISEPQQGDSSAVQLHGNAEAGHGDSREAHGPGGESGNADTSEKNMQELGGGVDSQEPHASRGREAGTQGGSGEHLPGAGDGQCGDAGTHGEERQELDLVSVLVTPLEKPLSADSHRGVSVSLSAIVRALTPDALKKLARQPPAGIWEQQPTTKWHQSEFYKAFGMVYSHVKKHANTDSGSVFLKQNVLRSALYVYLPKVANDVYFASRGPGPLYQLDEEEFDSLLQGAIWLQKSSTKNKDIAADSPVNLPALIQVLFSVMCDMFSGARVSTHS